MVMDNMKLLEQISFDSRISNSGVHTWNKSDKTTLMEGTIEEQGVKTLC